MQSKVTRGNLGNIDVGDGCWRPKVLVTSLRCWWPTYNIEKVTNITKNVANIMILPPTSQISHHHKVTNITRSPTSLSPSRYLTSYFKWVHIKKWKEKHMQKISISIFLSFCRNIQYEKYAYYFCSVMSENFCRLFCCPLSSLSPLSSFLTSRLLTSRSEWSIVSRFAISCSFIMQATGASNIKVQSPVMI